jgi:adenosylmethionine-8-amino-7-oxononanoate aminotransferase
MNEKNYLWPVMLAPALHGSQDRCGVSASGVRVTFADGSERLCGTSGLWNTNLGYGNAAVAHAVGEAMSEASYLGAWSFTNTRIRDAADRLVGLAGKSDYARVAFSTSGGSANDLAMKMVRHVQALERRPDRNVILGLQDGFHGMTFGAFALTDANLGHRMYAVDRRFVAHIPANNSEALVEIVSKNHRQIAALFVEPMLGTGAVALTDEYVRTMFELRSRYGFLIVADEVSTGFARLSRNIFASQEWPASPDLLVIAKAMTNGTVAASAVLMGRRVVDVLVRANATIGHAETQAGTAVVGAALGAVMDEFERLGALERSRSVSDNLDAELSKLVERCDQVFSTSGEGCLRAINLRKPGGELLDAQEVDSTVNSIRASGALVHQGPSCIQILPAFVYTSNDVAELLSRIENGIAERWVGNGAA